MSDLQLTAKFTKLIDNADVCYQRWLKTSAGSAEERLADREMNIANDELADFVVRNRDRIVVTDPPARIDETAPRIDAVTD